MGKRQEKMAAELEDLKARCSKDVESDLVKFKLEAAAKASPQLLSELFAVSNMGLRNRQDLDIARMEGVDPDPEIRAWRRVIDKAIELCGKHSLDLSNENVILFSYHKRAHNRY